MVAAAKLGGIMVETVILIASISSILGFLLGLAATNWGRRVLSDVWHGLGVPLLGVRMVGMGVYGFFDSRAALSRRMSNRILEYIGSAKKEFGVIALSLNYSIMHQNLHEEFRKMLKKNDQLNIYVFLIDPESDILSSVARATGRTPEELKDYIDQSWTRLWAVYDNLDESEKSRMHLHLYDTCIANTILVVDPEEKSGRILVENYLYKVPIEGRYSFECRRPGSSMFTKLRTAYEQFKKDYARVSRGKNWRPPQVP